MSFQIGDRIKLSDEAKRAGIQRHGDSERLGTVRGPVGRWVKVHWDGLSPRTVYYYHQDYIAIAVTNGHQQSEAT